MDHEQALEEAVTEYIGKLPMLWLAVPDPPNARAWLERNLIGLMSAAARAGAEISSPSWLGRFSPRREIRESALWNINFTDYDYEPRVVTEVAKRLPSGFART